MNTQIDLIPIISLSKEKDIVKKILEKNIKKTMNICDYDLFLHTTEKPMYIGTNNEMIFSPRLDDLTCTFAALKSFVENNMSLMNLFHRNSQ